MSDLFTTATADVSPARYPVVLAFLQNQWVKDPARVAELYARHGDNPERRAALNARFLFYRSLTGRRLKAAFGNDLCAKIIWEEASPKIAGKSDGVFPADLRHMTAVIEHFQPKYVLAFGSIAAEAAWDIWRYIDAGVRPGPRFLICQAPHPAARHSSVPKQLANCAMVLRHKLKGAPVLA